MIVKTYEDLYNWYVMIEKDGSHKCWAIFYTYVDARYVADNRIVKCFPHKDDNGEYTENIEDAMCKASLVVSAKGVWHEELQTADCDCFYVEEFLELAQIVEKVREICRNEIIKTCPNAATY